jgi:NAD(P)-dependent dehydrogenase (short-subunit alcohol dehydrogenase family)
LAKELGARKIAINIVAPGAILTDFGGGGVRDNPDVNQYLASQTAVGRWVYRMILAVSRFNRQQRVSAAFFNTRLTVEYTP